MSHCLSNHFQPESIQPEQPQPDQHDFSLAWAAGFADGEGCIYICKQRYKSQLRRQASYRLGFCITQNDLAVLQHFAQGLGMAGGLYQVKRLVGHSRQVYTLNYSGLHALNVLGQLLPHLIRKHSEALTAFDYWEQAQGGKHPGAKGWSPEVTALRESFYQQMKALK